MKLLVTGGAGFIGSHLVRSLLADDHEVLNVDLLTHAGSERTIADCIDHPKHRLLQADIGDAVAMRQAHEDFQPQRVIHLAAESHVDRSIDAPQRFMETNVMGTFTLLQEARRHWLTLESSARDDFRFLHVSTDEVYGSVAAGDAFRETTAYDPHSPYSASKAASDHLVRAWYHTYGLPILITHSSNNYGPFQSPDKLVPMIILNALNLRDIPIYGDGSHVRDWLHVEDHVDALKAVLAKGTPGDSYNIGGNHQRTNLDLANHLCELLDEMHTLFDDSGEGHAGCITHVADRPGHDQRYAIDDCKLREQIGWQPQRDPATGFRDTVQWYLDHRDWAEDMRTQLES